MRTWLNKLDPLYDNLPFMEIEGEGFRFPLLGEVKLDGEFQYVIKPKDEDNLYLANKQQHGRIRTEMPALFSIEKAIPRDSVLLAELVWGAGKDFYDFARHKLDPDCNLGIFGCLKYAGHQLWNVATHEQVRQLLEKQTFYNDKVALVPSVEIADREELDDLFNRFVSAGFEGLIAKQKGSKYINGKSYDWTKWKYWTEGDFVICGYQSGTRRAKKLSVLVGHLVNGEITPLTHVGGGFKVEEKDDLLQVLQTMETGRSGDEIYVRPEIVIKVLYNGVIRNPDGSINSLRHPRFDRLRPDKTPDEIEALK